MSPSVTGLLVRHYHNTPQHYATKQTTSSHLLRRLPLQHRVEEPQRAQRDVLLEPLARAEGGGARARGGGGRQHRAQRGLGGVRVLGMLC
jgi:hypothetical protein